VLFGYVCNNALIIKQLKIKLYKKYLKKSAVLINKAINSLQPVGVWHCKAVTGQSMGVWHCKAVTGQPMGVWHCMAVTGQPMGVWHCKAVTGFYVQCTIKVERGVPTLNCVCACIKKYLKLLYIVTIKFLLYYINK
jgi:hypothetical protein